MGTGETSKTVTVNVHGDYRVEPNERFLVMLSQPTGATIDNSAGAGNGDIVNDDVPASLTAPGAQSGNEGASVTFNLGTLTDARPAGPWTIGVNWGDSASGTYSVTSPGALTRAHTYADNGSYTVTVSASDVDGVASSNTITFTATIANVNPTATLGNNGPINEGGSATVSFSGPVDPSSVDTTAGFRYAFSCSNGSLAAATYAGSGTSASTSCAFDDSAGPSTVRARIIDKDGGFTEYTTAVTVNDVPPSLTAPPGQNGLEGSSIPCGLGTLADPGADSPWTITVNWGDGQVESFPVNTTGALTRSHAYADNGSYTVTVSARDKDNVASNSVTFATVIANVAPVVTSAGSAINENGVATVTGTIADPGRLDTFVMTVAWGDGTSNQYPLAAGSTTYSVMHQYLDDNPTGTPLDTAAVMIAVTDKDGGSGSASTGVAIANVDPVVGSLLLRDTTGSTIGGAILALSGLPLALEASFTDVGTLDTHQATISWGDGTSGPGIVAGSGGNGTIRGSHTWTSLGTVTVQVNVTDDDTGAASRQTTLTVTNATGAVCALGQLVTPLLSDPALSPAVRSGLTQLLGQIQGNIDGQAANGACDMFAKDNWVAALVKLEQAVGTIEAMVAGGGLSSTHLTVLRQVETHLILAAKWTHLTLARVVTDPRKLADAAALAGLAEAATVSGEYVTAIGHWLAAVRLLAPGT